MSQAKALSTKQKIIYASIDLFAQKGFKEVSVRELAAAVGIKASSLYKHFESKEDILDHIFIMFKERMAQTVLEKEKLKGDMDMISPENFFQASFERFKLVMWQPEIVKISKIITIEQQRNHTVRQFFIGELIEKPILILKHAFDLMMENGVIDPVDTRALAEEYNGYVVFLYFEQNFLREALDLDEIERKMKQHNDFYANHVLIRKGERRK